MNKKIIWGVVIALVIIAGFSLYNFRFDVKPLNCCHGEQYEVSTTTFDNDLNIYLSPKFNLTFQYPKSWSAAPLNYGLSAMQNQGKLDEVGFKITKDGYGTITAGGPQSAGDTCISLKSRTVLTKCRDITLSDRKTTLALSTDSTNKETWDVLDQVFYSIRYIQPIKDFKCQEGTHWDVRVNGCKMDIVQSDSDVIKLISPNGSELLKLGQSYEIKFQNTDTKNGGSIYISPKGRDMDKSLVVDGIAFKAQAYSWKVGEVYSPDFKSRIKVSPGEYKIGVCITKNVNSNLTEDCDWSDNYFTITSPTNTPSTPSIKIISPTAADVWIKGQNHERKTDHF